MHLSPGNYDIASSIVFKSHVTRRPRDLHVVNTNFSKNILYVTSGDLGEILTLFYCFVRRYNMQPRFHVLIAYSNEND